MSRISSLVVKDILSSIDRIQTYISDLSFDDFLSNYMLQEACLYNIQVIGEAVSQLSDDVKKSEPKIPWVLIKGMRNRLIHEYFGTDLPVVWNVIKNELPGFKNELQRIYQKLIAEEK